MSHLLHPKLEAFCQAYVRGPFAGNCSSAYETAGYQPNSSNAARLIGRPYIRKRIDQLLAENADADRKAVEAHGVEKHKVIEELSKIGFANFFDFLSVDDDEQVTVDLMQINRDQGAAIREFVVEYTDPDANGRRYLKSARVRLSDKRLALADLARHLGMFPGQRLAEPEPPETPETDEDDEPQRKMSNAEIEEALIGTFSRLAGCNIDLRDLLDRAVAAGKVKESPNPIPLREIETLDEAIARCRKELME